MRQTFGGDEMPSPMPTLVANTNGTQRIVVSLLFACAVVLWTTRKRKQTRA